MNLTMQQPIRYPLYMDSPCLPFSLAWPSNPFHFPSQSQQYFSTSCQLLPSFTLSSYPFSYIPFHLPRYNPFPKTSNSFSSYTNTRYNHLKQSTSYNNRHRPVDMSLRDQRYSIPNYYYQLWKNKSVANFHPLPCQNSTTLLKAHSWHSMNHLHQPKLNGNYTKEIPLVQENHRHRHHHHYHHHRQNSLTESRKFHKKNLSSSSLSKQQQTIDDDIVRISTFDEAPVIRNPLHEEKTQTSGKNTKTVPINYKKQSSPSSTISSHSSSQKFVNSSMCHGPSLIAAKEDFRQPHRTLSQNTSLTPHRPDFSRDSLCSMSTHHSSSESRSQSQSSFTSIERLEIRYLIKAFKSKDLQTLNIPIQTSSNLPLLTERFMPKNSSPPSIIKPEKSSIAEELDRKFNKLRSNNPNQELVCVKPSLVNKQEESISPLRICDELLDRGQISTADKSIKKKQIKEKTYENPLVPVSVSPTTPKLLAETFISEENISEIKHDYAIPIKQVPEVNLRSTKNEDKLRSFSFCKPINDIDNERYQNRPLSMFNWLYCGLTNPFPSTYHSNSTRNQSEHQYDKSLVKENIYASDIDVHVPLPNDKDYLNNQTIKKDYFSNNKQTKNNSSILTNFSCLFTRFGPNKREKTSKLKTKLNNNNNNIRCSIM